MNPTPEKENAQAAYTSQARPPALALTLPLRGRQLIEASAGTGKTFTIALLYVRLVLGQRDPGGAADGEAALLPPDILVMTFTEAATEELRSRIRERLVEAAALFRVEPDPDFGNTATENPLQALRDGFPPAQWPRLARRLQLAAEWMDDAAVSTIHGWCNRMLHEHAFDSANLFQQQLVTDLKDLQREAIHDYWRTRFYPLDTARAAAVRSQYASPDALLGDVRDLLARDDAVLHYHGEPVSGDELPATLEQMTSAAADLEAAEDEARRCYRDSAGEVRQLLIHIRPNLNLRSFAMARDDADFAQWLDRIDAWSRGEPADDGLLKLGRSRLKLTKKAEVPDHPFFDRIDDWQAQADASEGIGPRLKAVIRADARDWVHHRLQQQLRVRAELGFDDLLRRLDAALHGAQGDTLAQRIHSQFPVALIDEFQDTDPLQYRIFSRVYDRDEGDTSLVLIGDPKQAIYSFRGADIHTYLKAQQSTPENQRHSLGTNFRSSDAMVKAVNHLFIQAERHSLGAFRFAGDPSPLQFHPVQAKGRRETLELDGHTPHALTAWLWEQRDVVRSGTCQQVMAEHAAEQIAGWLNGAAAGRSGFRDGDRWRALQPRDLAILVRNGKEAREIRAALQRRGLTSVYLSDRDSVFESLEAHDLLTWLRACAEPEDDRLVHAALGTAILDLPLAQLDRLLRDELAWERLQERFAEYHQRWRRQGVLPMLRRLLHEFDVPGHHLQREGGQRTLTNLLHLAEWAQQASDTLDGEQALIHSLATHIHQPSAEEQVLRLESDAELIQVVTIHKSKGLEYPVVVLPFAYAWRDARGSQAIWQDSDGPVLELASSKAAPDPWARSDEERLGEDLRLFYVALTRARHATFIGAAPLAPGNHGKAQIHKGALGYLLAGGAPIDNAAGLRAALEAVARDTEFMTITPVPEIIDNTPWQPPPASGTFRPAREPGHAPFAPWWVASYSALQTHRASETPPLPDTARDETRGEEFQRPVGGAHRSGNSGDGKSSGETGTPAPDSIHGFPRGPEPGTFLHGLLEWAGQQGFGQLLAAPDDPLRTHWLPQIERRAQARGWQQHSTLLGQWLHRLLTTPLPLAHTDSTLTLSRLQGYRVEEEFWFSTHRVDTRALDALVSAHILPGQPRPALDERHLNGLLKGFIDLVARQDDRYYVIDWKSNYLGPDAGSYTSDGLEPALLAKRYDVQLSLYLLALHRHLRRVLPDYDYDRHVGGGLLVFLRGIDAPGAGVFHAAPPLAFVSALDALFDGQPLPPNNHLNPLAETH